MCPRAWLPFQSGHQSQEVICLQERPGPEVAAGNQESRSSCSHFFVLVPVLVKISSRDKPIERLLKASSDWLAHCDPGGLGMTVHCQQDTEPGNWFTAECLSSPSMGPRDWRVPRELLVYHRAEEETREVAMFHLRLAQTSKERWHIQSPEHGLARGG